jgi:hypothetical protein
VFGEVVGKIVEFQPDSGHVIKARKGFEPTALSGVTGGTDGIAERTEMLKGQVNRVKGIDRSDFVGIRVGGDKGRGGIIQGEELYDALTCLGRPINEGKDISKVADTGALLCAKGEKRDCCPDEFERGNAAKSSTANEKTFKKRERFLQTVQTAIFSFFPKNYIGMGFVK